MRTFRLEGLDHDFAPLFRLTDAELAASGARRLTADSFPGYPCRVSLEDAAIGEELLLLPFEHQPAASPYRSTGPIFVRDQAARRILGDGEVPPYVTRRLISIRAYDADDMMIDAAVCEGELVRGALHALLENTSVAYIHLHNAKRGCFSCVARPVEIPLDA